MSVNLAGESRSTCARRSHAGPHTNLRILLGAAVWLAALAFRRPTPFAPDWAGFLLTFAALVLVPMTLRLIAVEESSGSSEPRRLCWILDSLLLPAAVLLQIAFLWEPGAPAALLTLPWATATVLAALCGVLRFVSRRRRFTVEAALDVGMIYLAVGGAWTLLARAGIAPLDFKPIIVLLTGIHFHYAGFVLPVVTGLAAGRVSTGAAVATAALVTASVPLVAAGITSTQLGGPPVFEAGAALLMSLGGALAARLQWQASRDIPCLPVRVLLRFSSLSLAVAMVFASLYGLRSFGLAPWLDIPWMRVLHGTTNVFGFALSSVLSWSLHAGAPAPGQEGETVRR